MGVRVSALWMAGFASLALAAGSRLAPADARRSIDDSDVREYVRLSAALGARDPDSLDYLYAPTAWTAEAVGRPPSFAVIRERALALAARLDQRSDPIRPQDARCLHLVGQLRAVAARVDVLSGTRWPFDQESMAFFGVMAPRADEAAVREIHAQLAHLLPGAGPLHARYAEFVRRHLVPPARVPAVFARALDGCRGRTLEHLSLPEHEQVQVSYVDGTGWTRYSRYRGAYRSLIEINAAHAMTVDGALALACHEGYPGHHVQNSLTEARMVRRLGWTEFTVLPAFTPQSLVSEGAAVQAVDVSFPGSARATFERDELLPLAGLEGRDAARLVQVERLVEQLRPVQADLARDYLDGHLEFVRAASALSARALVPHPDPMLKFINEYRSYAVTYTWGADLVGGWIARRNPRGDPGVRWSLYETILAEPGAPLSREPAP